MNIEVTSPIESEIKEWKPNPKQEKFISLPFSIFEAFYGGSKGPGKTDALVVLPILYRFHENSNYKGIYLRRTYADIEREILDRQRKYYPSTGAVLNEQKRRWKWPNGAIDRLGHAEHEQDIREYDTDEYHLIRWDELTHFLPFQYQYLSFTRCRSSDPFLPAIIRAAGNPGNIGHTWVRRRFIDPCKTGYKILRDPLTGKKRIFIPALLSDNPHINPDYAITLKLLPEAEYRAAMGDWFTFSGQVFEEWRVEPFQNEPENACHVIKPFPIPSWWPKIIAIDWGWDAATCIGWGAVAPNGQVFVYRIYNERHKYIPEWVRDLVNLTYSEWDSIRRIKICHSAAQHRGEPKSIIDQVSEELKAHDILTSVELGKRDRIGGKLLVHEYLRWRPRSARRVDEEFNQDLAERILRNHGPKMYNEYMKFFENIDEINIPKLQIFNHCQSLIDCIPTCQYDQKDGINTEDVAGFKGDDPYDMLRMLLESVDEYVNDASDEFKERGKVDAILQHYSETGDATSFYRAMEHLEQNKSQDKAVCRSHRLRRQMQRM